MKSSRVNGEDVQRYVLSELALRGATRVFNLGRVSTNHRRLHFYFLRMSWETLA